MTKLTKVMQSIRRSPYQSLSAFIMTTITFFVVTLFAILVYSTHELLTYFESRPQVTAFFHDDATNEEVEAIKQEIESTGKVSSIRYISKQEALTIYQDENKDNPLLLEMVTADILPASLEVSSHDVQELGALAQILKDEKTVEEVVYQQDVVDILSKWVNGIRIGGVALVGILLIGSLVTMIVILGMRVASRKSEIQTLWLLGANGWYIRSPFLVEGLIYAFVGVVVGWGFAYLLLLYLTPNLLDFFAGINLLPIPVIFMFSALLTELLVAFFLGIFASLSATRRYGK